LDVDVEKQNALAANICDWFVIVGPENVGFGIVQLPPGMPGPLTVTVLFGFGQTLNAPERLLGMGNDIEVLPLLMVLPLLKTTGTHVPGGSDCA
jgi:hypothetical protein